MFVRQAGAHLQYQGNQLAEKVMHYSATRSESVSVLPVHDSFIADHGYGNEIEEAMRDAFRRMFSVNIPLDGRERESEYTGYVIKDTEFENLLTIKDMTFRAAA